MQTFLPYQDFYKCASVLDYRRLGKQRLECKQIILALTGQTNAWRNHPCTKMWDGYVPFLACYGLAVCTEWINRGYKDSLLPFMLAYSYRHISDKVPYWLGDERLHRSHRAALLYKQPEHYNQFGWSEEPELNYYWPR